MRQLQTELKEESAHLRDQSEKLKGLSYTIRYDSSWKKMKDRYNVQKDFNIILDSNICRVVIPKFIIPDINIPGIDSLFSTFDDIANNFRFYAHSIPRIEYFDDKLNFHINDDSLRTFEFRYFNMDSLMNTQRDIMDSLRNYDWNNMHYLNDSLAFKNFPGFENFFRNYSGGSEIELQMQELKKELEKFRNEMRDWRKEMNKKYKTTDENNKMD